MMAGFDINSPLVCEGIIGDGCGGGRIFFVEDETLQVYDPTTQEKMPLLYNVINAKELSKKACILTIVCDNKSIQFDLSKMRVISE